MARHCIIPLKGKYHRAICLKCGTVKPWGSSIACSCGGLIILIQDDSDLAGVRRVDAEVLRLEISKEARDKVMKDEFSNVKMPLPKCCSSSHEPPDTACRSFEAGMNGRCVYCDHALKCHPGPGATCEIGSGG